MSDVFISYSRKNSDFARRLIDRLTLKGKDAWVDWEGIPLTSPNWWNEIKAGVESADSFVFILSPDSMASVVCNMELDYAVELGKRIVPIVFEEVVTRDAFASIADFEPDDAMTERLQGKDPLLIARDNWQRLSHINWVFFREGDDFDAAFDALVQTVETDLEYVKAHTRYLTRATEWQREQQRADLLLFGEEIDRAEAWLQKAETYTRTLAAQAKQEVVNPLAQDVQREYIRVSREADKRRKRLARSAQLSIAVLGIVLIAGLVIGSAIVSNTQQEASNIQATSDQNVAVANTQVAGAEVEAQDARDQANAAATDVADANDALTAVPPTLTQVNEQVVFAEGQADAANTQVADANDALTAVPPTLTQVNQQVVTAEERADAANTQVADANDALTAVPPTLTQVNEQVVFAEGQADAANTEVADANDALTAVPPTLTQVNEQVVLAVGQADAANTQVADANDALTAVPPTLTQVSQQVVSAEERADAANTQVVEIQETVIPATLDAVATQVQSAEDFARSLDLVAVARDIYDNQDRWTGIDLAFEISKLPNTPPQALRALADLAYSPGARTRLTGHESYVYGVEYAPEADRLYTLGLDNQIMVWDANTGSRLDQWTVDLPVYEADISPDGRYLVIGHEAIEVWEIATQSRVLTLDGFSGTVNSLQFNPDGTRILTSADTGAAIWDASTGDRVLRFTPSVAYFAEYSPDGETAYTSLEDGLIAVWDAKTGALIRSIERRAGQLAVSPDGQLLATSSGGKIILLSTETGDVLREFEPLSEDVIITRDLEFNPSGDQLATVNGDTWGASSQLMIWDVASGELTDSFDQDNWLWTASYRPDGRQITTGSWDETAVIWDVDSGAIVNRFGQFENSVTSIDINELDGGILAGLESGQISVLDYETGEELRRFEGHTRPVATLDLCPAGRYVASAGNADEIGEDAEILVWDIDSGDIIHNLRVSPSNPATSERIDSLAFSQDCRLLLSAGSNSLIVVWEMETGAPMEILASTMSTWGGTATFSDDARLIASQGGPGFEIWDVQSGQMLQSFRSWEGFDRIALSSNIVFGPDETTVIVGDDSGRIHEWDVATGALLRTLIGHTFSVSSLSLSPNGERLASGSFDTNVILWDYETGEIIQRFDDHNSAILDLTFRLDTLELVSSSGSGLVTDPDDPSLYDNSIIVWRNDSLDQLQHWVRSNRYTPGFSCDEVQTYGLRTCGDDLPESTLMPTQTPLPLPEQTTLLLTPVSSEVLEDTVAYNDRGNEQFALGNYNQAIADYTQAIRLDSEYSIAFYNRGLAHYNLRNYDEAIADYTESIRLNPEYANAFNNRGVVYRDIGQYEAAIEDFEDAIRLDPDHQLAYSNMGDSYRNLGDYENAILSYSEAIVLDPDSRNAYFYRGLTYHYSQDYENAVIDYNQAIRLDPEYAVAYNNRGVSLNSLGQYEDAIESFDAALQLDSEYTLAHNNRGWSYLNLAEYATALNSFGRAIELSPRYSSAYWGRGNAYYELGQLEDAVADYRMYEQLEGELRPLMEERIAEYEASGQ